MQDSTQKIILLGLPQSLENALREQLARQNDLAIETEDTENPADLIIFKSMQTGDVPLALKAGIPALPIHTQKPQRLGVMLRQIGQMLAEPALYLDPFLIGRFTFYPAEKRLETAAGDIALTDREVDILAFLARHHGTTVSRDMLLKKVWRYQAGLDTHTLETHIYRLRQKIEDNAETPVILSTTDGGYSLNLS